MQQELHPFHVTHMARCKEVSLPFLLVTGAGHGSEVHSNAQDAEVGSCQLRPVCTIYEWASTVRGIDM